MSHYKAPDHKREQFRRYLEKAGVVDSLTSVLVALYEQPEKPTNALEYPHCSNKLNILVQNKVRCLKPKLSRFVKQHLGTPGLTESDTEALQQEVVDLRQRCARLEEENLDLKARLEHHEPPPEEPAVAE
ncbi:c-Myc-binding protein-like isoform X1 [Syngnathus acus]|uniref:c-Myc-binding protein-like isoform X1 n=1 Tax=Syngnathus acus TaxID=161584 RepID=UPI001885B726|nr:c-Myc-binding protein-like isoform X1 [Syngnathus acus]